MGQRRHAREFTLQILFQVDLTGEAVDDVVRRFWAGVDAEDDVQEFAERLARGVESSRKSIDERISGAARNWRLERMPVVDRNVLRMAVFELSAGETPPPVVIDEAIEIARRFGHEESGRFINGILDTIAERIRAEAPGAEA